MTKVGLDKFNQLTRSDDFNTTIPRGSTQKQYNKVEQQIKRMLSNSRARSKIDYFLLHWLQINEKGEFSKDEEQYAQFN